MNKPDGRVKNLKREGISNNSHNIPNSYSVYSLSHHSDSSKGNDSMGTAMSTSASVCGTDDTCSVHNNSTRNNKNNGDSSSYSYAVAPYTNSTMKNQTDTNITINSNSDNTTTSNDDDTKKSQTKKKRKLSYTPSKLGRKGDPRMHNALKARVANPNLSLYDALTQGGFEFHYQKRNENGIITSCDRDNVSLGQRKNQLSRRLRLYKQTSDKKKEEFMKGAVKSKDECTQNNNSIVVGTDNTGNKKDKNLPYLKSELMKSGKTEDCDKKCQDLRSNGYDEKSELPQIKRTTILNETSTSSTSVRNIFSDDNSLQLSLASGVPSFMSPSIPTNNNSIQINDNSSVNVKFPNSNDYENFIQNLIPKESYCTSTVRDYQNHFWNQYHHLQNNINSATTSANSESSMSVNNHFHKDINKSVIMNDDKTTIKNDNNQSDKEQKLYQALSLYRCESSTLIKRCMISSGFALQETEECDEMYLLFCEMALNYERQRIARMKSRMNSANTIANDTTITDKLPMNKSIIKTNSMMNNASNAITTVGGNVDNRRAPLDLGSINTSTSIVSSKPSVAQVFVDSHQHNHDHDHQHNHYVSNTNNNNNVCQNQHVHRLEGKCGHKAIIHKPADGNAHIDFIVDGKIECFENCQPMIDSTAFWLSNKRCEKNNQRQKHDCSDCVVLPLSNEGSGVMGPKVLDVNDVNLDGDEWSKFFDVNTEGFMEEEILENLFKLGDSK